MLTVESGENLGAADSSIDAVFIRGKNKAADLREKSKVIERLFQ